MPDVNVGVNVITASAAKPNEKTDVTDEVTAKPNEKTDATNEVTESKTVTDQPAKPNEKVDITDEVTKTKVVTDKPDGKMVDVNPKNVVVNVTADVNVGESSKKHKKIDVSSL